MKKQTFITTLFIGLFGIVNAQFWDHSNPAKVQGSINTDAEESMPVFSQDSSILYFVRTFDENNKGGETDQDIWYSRKDENGGYSNCARLKGVNNKFNNAVVGINRGGTAMYVLNSYDGKKDVEKGIAVSKGGGTNWSSPKKMEVAGLDIEGDFYGFHMNTTENAIVISYSGPGSVGQEDLYVSLKDGDTWKEPMHMGNTINSTGYEISPFLSKGDDTLFFSSDGFPGSGDADIYYSVNQGGWANWSKPVNLGSRINSPKFDAYFIHSGSQAYWSSNREAERSDIYMIDIYTPPPLFASCTGVDASVYQATDGSVDLLLEGGAPPFTFEWSNGSMIEDLSGLAKGEYTVTVTDAVGQTATSTCVVDEPPLVLDPVVVVEYENMEFAHNFTYNKNKLSTSRGKLKRFVKQIVAQFKDGRESITINIVSSASMVPTKTYVTNEKLAQIRAENMKYDLVTYFEKKEEYKGRVNVVIVTSKVGGPAYEDDSANKEKYFPYQFVKLNTE